MEHMAINDITLEYDISSQISVCKDIIDIRPRREQSVEYQPLSR